MTKIIFEKSNKGQKGITLCDSVHLEYNIDSTFLREKSPILPEITELEVMRHFKELSDKFEVFIELINWLNDNNIVIIPEKTLFSAFLGITVEIYNDLLANSKNEEVKNLFKNIDEYFTTQQFGALINNDRKSLERIQKLKSYGQEMMQTQPDVLKITNNNHYLLSA